MNLQTLQRIVRAAERVHDIVQAALTVLFLVLVAAALAAWLGGGWPLAGAAAGAALLLGIPLAKRLWL